MRYFPAIYLPACSVGKNHPPVRSSATDAPISVGVNRTDPLPAITRLVYLDPEPIGQTNSLSPSSSLHAFPFMRSIQSRAQDLHAWLVWLQGMVAAYMGGLGNVRVDDNTNSRVSIIAPMVTLPTPQQLRTMNERATNQDEDQPRGQEDESEDERVHEAFSISLASDSASISAG